jgi:hypothetical protein
LQRSDTKTNVERIRGHPLTSSVIAKIVKGKGFRGALNYLFRDGRATIIGGNLSGRIPRELAAEFGQFRKLRPGLAKAVVHIPLSAHPDDRPLSDAEMADRMTQGLGYAMPRAPVSSCGTTTPATSTCTCCCAESTDTAIA